MNSSKNQDFNQNDIINKLKEMFGKYDPKIFLSGPTIAIQDENSSEKSFFINPIFSNIHQYGPQNLIHFMRAFFEIKEEATELFKFNSMTENQKREKFGEGIIEGVYNDYYWERLISELENTIREKSSEIDVKFRLFGFSLAKNGIGTPFCDLEIKTIKEFKDILDRIENKEKKFKHHCDEQASKLTIEIANYEFYYEKFNNALICNQIQFVLIINSLKYVLRATKSAAGWSFHIRIYHLCRNHTPPYRKLTDDDNVQFEIFEYSSRNRLMSMSFHFNYYFSCIKITEHGVLYNGTIIYEIDENDIKSNDIEKIIDALSGFASTMPKEPLFIPTEQITAFYDR